jgi:hypothetical protein
VPAIQSDPPIRTIANASVPALWDSLATSFGDTRSGAGYGVGLEAFIGVRLLDAANAVCQL